MISNDNQVSFHFAVDDNDYYKVRVEFMEIKNLQPYQVGLRHYYLYHND